MSLLRTALRNGAGASSTTHLLFPVVKQEITNTGPDITVDALAAVGQIDRVPYLEDFIDQSGYHPGLGGFALALQSFGEQRNEFVPHAQFGINEKNGHVRPEIPDSVEEGIHRLVFHSPGRRGFYFHVNEIACNYGYDVIVFVIDRISQADVEQGR